MRVWTHNVTFISTYKASWDLSHRSSRRCPAGLNRFCVPGRWAGRDTVRSSPRRLLPPTAPALRFQRAEPWYRPSWFLFTKLQCLLQTSGQCLLHVSGQLRWAVGSRQPPLLYRGSRRLHQLSCDVWAGPRNFLNSRNMSGHYTGAEVSGCTYRVNARQTHVTILHWSVFSVHPSPSWTACSPHVIRKCAFVKFASTEFNRGFNELYMTCYQSWFSLGKL